MMLQGKQFIGGERRASGQEIFYSTEIKNNSKDKQPFYKATPQEIDEAVQKAELAFNIYRKMGAEKKAVFLETIAAEIMNLGDLLITTCHKETALPIARLEGERGRTCNQLKLFASLLREGSWVDARIDRALPDRQPLPRVDIRAMLRPLGPVVVFGASNFPLAFSVAGGDTASALAAGCPVIVKAHEAHPGTSELVAMAIQKAANKTGMPEGVFSMLYGDGPVVGIQLVQHAGVKAVGFTGSFRGGKAIFDAAMQRQEPIPVYAEMSSVNPVFVLPKALQARGEEIATAFAASVALGVGQFCTCPGLLFYREGDGQIDFKKQLGNAFQSSTGGIMLTEGIHASYLEALNKLTSCEGVELISTGEKPAGTFAASPTLLAAAMDSFLNNPSFSEEVFGPASLVVNANNTEQLLKAARQLEGHLTATVHGTEDDLLEHKELLELLEQKVGRIVINGFPTGVEVSSAMVHGGPFPATTDSRSTSVGTGAILRFTRPVCYQDYPQALLPAELKDENPLNIWRLLDSQRTKDPLTS